MLTNQGERATVTAVDGRTGEVAWRVDFTHGGATAEGLAYDETNRLLAIVSEPNAYELYRVEWEAESEAEPAVDRLADALWERGVRCLVFDWDGALSLGVWAGKRKPELRTAFFNLLFSWLARHPGSKAAVATFNGLDIASSTDGAAAAQAMIRERRAGVRELLRDRFVFVGGRFAFVRFSSEGAVARLASLGGDARLADKQRHIDRVSRELGVGVDSMALFDESGATMLRFGWRDASGRYKIARGGRDGSPNTSAYVGMLLCLSVFDRVDAENNRRIPNTRDMEDMIGELRAV